MSQGSSYYEDSYCINTPRCEQSSDSLDTTFMNLSSAVSQLIQEQSDDMSEQDRRVRTLRTQIQLAVDQAKTDYIDQAQFDDLDDGLLSSQMDEAKEL